RKAFETKIVGCTNRQLPIPDPRQRIVALQQTRTAHARRKSSALSRRQIKIIFQPASPQQKNVAGANFHALMSCRILDHFHRNRISRGLIEGLTPVCEVTFDVDKYAPPDDAV